jgi:exopolysaccharide biosynthesis polyprenyl glycosylphosphotransferase
VLVVGDVVATVTAWLLALGLTGWTDHLLVATAAGVAGVLVIARVRGLYLARVSSVRSIELTELIRASAGGAAAGAIVLAEFEASSPPVLRLAILVATLQFLLLAATRSGFDDWIKDRRRRGRYCRRLLLFGFDSDLARLQAVVDEQPELGYRILGYVGPPAPYDPKTLVRLGGYGDVMRLVDELDASGVVVAAAASVSPSAAEPLDALLRSGVHVQVSPGLRGIDPRRIRSLPVGHQPLLYVEQMRPRAWRQPIKRMVDLVLAPLVLLIGALPLLAAAVAVKLDDGGPIFFSQERVGRKGEPFRLWKLRTMTVDAEARRADLEGDNRRTGPLFKAPDDPRVTRPGRLLRVLSLDELPQLWNVIVGDMTLVGPRPALASEVEDFDLDLRRRHDVTPGLTGLWQLEARDNPSFGPYRRLDLYYVDNWSLRHDALICARTVRVVLSGRGAA